MSWGTKIDYPIQETFGLKDYQFLIFKLQGLPSARSVILNMKTENASHQQWKILLVLDEKYHHILHIFKNSSMSGESSPWALIYRAKNGLAFFSRVGIIYFVCCSTRFYNFSCQSSASFFKINDYNFKSHTIYHTIVNTITVTQHF